MEDIFKLLETLRPEFDFRNSNNYIEDGFLDSFDVVNIVSEIENTYGIVVDALDIVPENFVSVEVIVKMIEKNGGKVL